MSNRIVIGVVLVVQVICAALYLLNFAATVTGFARVPWLVHELIELGAALGLLLGVLWAVLAMRSILRRNRLVEAQLRAASGAFMDLLEERFTDWGLTPAERDVALFAIKGMSTSEIAGLRETSEGTVKAQTNAIYRKAGVSGRPQLLSLFIEELMDGPVGQNAAQHSKAS